MQSPVCPACATPLPTDSFAGACPTCLLRLAVKASSGSGARGGDGGAEAADLFGDYELLEPLAAGGMGVVFKARQRSLGRIVALKRIRGVPSESLVDRFRNEARAAASLVHPHIVPIHDFGCIDGEHFYTMELIEGRTLGELVRDGPLPARRAAGYLKAVAGAVQFAHEHGVLHRDLKPSNVLVDRFDQPRVTDFGLAKQFAVELGPVSPDTGSDSGRERRSLPAPVASDLTLTGQVFGSPGFMSPEQASARRGAAGPRSDVYSLGAMLYHLLTARPPFQAESIPDTLHELLHAEPVSPRRLNPSVPDDLETVCLKCLEKDPGRRYGSARELEDDLGRFLAGDPIRARRLGRVEKAWRWCRRKRAVAALLAALLVTLLAGFGGVIWQWRRADRHAASETRERRRAEIEAYAARMRIAFDSLKTGNRGQANALLKSYRRREGVEDLRGFEWRYLWRRGAGDEEFSVVGSSNRILVLAFSPDGRTLLSGGNDRIARVWDLEARKLSFRIEADVGSHRGMAMLPDRGSIILGGASGVVLRSGPGFAREQRLPSALGSLELAPDGRTLVTEGTNGIMVWNTSDWRPLRVIGPRGSPGEEANATFAFSEDGRVLAVSVPDPAARRIELWEVGVLRSADQGARPITVLREGTGTMEGVFRLRFSPDGRLLLSAAGQEWSQMRLEQWDVTSGTLKASAPCGQIVRGLEVLKAGGAFVKCSVAQEIEVWDLSSLKAVHSTLAHDHEIWALARSADGNRFATGGKDGTIKVWTVDALRRDSGPVVLAENERVEGFAFADGGSRLVTTRGSAVGFWDVGTGVRQERQVAPEPVPMTSLSPEGLVVHWSRLSPDGRQLAQVLTSGAVQVSRLEPGSAGLVRAIELAPPQPGTPRPQLAWSPCGEFLAACIGSGNHDVHVWNAATGRRLATFPFANPVFPIVLSRGGRMLAVGRMPAIPKAAGDQPSPRRAWPLNSDLEVWAVDSQTRAVGLPATHREGVEGMAFSPDATLLASVSVDNTAKLWSLPHGQLRAELVGHRLSVHSAAFSPDGRTLATCGSDGLILWNVATAQEMMVLPSAGGGLVAFSPDGRALAAGGAGRGVILFSAPSFDEIAIWEAGRSSGGGP